MSHDLIQRFVNTRMAPLKMEVSVLSNDTFGIAQIEKKIDTNWRLIQKSYFTIQYVYVLRLKTHNEIQGETMFGTK